MAELKTEIRQLAGELLEAFSTARKRVALYPPEHEQVQSILKAMSRVLFELHQDLELITLSIVGNEIYFEGRLLAEQSQAYSGLVEALGERHLANITFYRGVSVEHLGKFVQLTILKPDRIEARGGWSEILREEGIEGVAIDRKVALEGAWEAPEASESVYVSRDVYRRAIEAALASYMDARARQMVNMEMVEGVVKLLVSSISSNPEIMSALMQIKQNDEYTLSHSVNVAVLSLLMGSKLNMPGPLLHRLGVAALLHDIGKTQVSENIINKKGKLTNEEWEIMQSHSLAGAKILSEQKNVDDLAIVVASEHHAREDLTGYPRFHALKKLHTMSKIVAIVDTYDALTSDRSYRKAITPDRAMRLILEGRGSHFDPIVLKVFAQLSGMFPVGTLVKLDTDEYGVVYKANSKDIYRPQIKLLSFTGTDTAEFRLVDLTEKLPDGTFARTILQSIDPEDHDIDVSAYF